MDTVVDALVPATQQAEPVQRRQFTGHRLVEAASSRTQKQKRPWRIDCFDGLEDRLRAHHHPRATSERGVVDGAMDVAGVLPDVVTPQVEDVGTAGSAQQADRAEVVDEAGEQRENIDPQAR